MTPESISLQSISLRAKLWAASLITARQLADPLEHLRWVESGEPFEAAGVAGFLEDVPEQADSSSGEEVAQILAALHGPAPSLGELYLAAAPRRERHTSGEYYTPAWLVELVLDRVGFEPGARLIDPMCGAGAFLVAAITRLRRLRPEAPVSEITRCVQGIDANPRAVMMARAEYLAALAGCAGLSPREPITIPVRRGDAILDGDAGDAPGHGEVADNDQRFDLAAGNPPWVGWESLPPAYRAATKDLWRRHGLFPDGGAGMQAMLGRGRKDLSMLATFVVADKLLRPGGRLSFVIAQSVFKSVGGGAGFRRLVLGDGTPLGVEQVDDLSGRRVFANAAARAAVVTLVKGERTVYPVSCRVWGARGGVAQEGWAEPVDRSDATSAWLTGTREGIDKVRRVLGPSSYRARAGAYTGGANGVYWLREMETPSSSGRLTRVANMPEAGKRMTPLVEAEVESDLIYPLLRAGDVRRFEAKPAVSILLTQDPFLRRGIEPGLMSADFPRALAWLEGFRGLLAERRDRGTRSLIAAGAPFYTMFSVTTDTMSPWKVVWPRIASAVRAAAVGPIAGRPVVPQETCTFIPCAGEHPDMEAHYLAGLLNSTLFNEAAAAFSQKAGKSFGAPHLLRQIAVPRFDPRAESHRALAMLVTRKGPGLDQAELDEAACTAWALPALTVRPEPRRARPASRARAARPETT